MHFIVCDETVQLHYRWHGTVCHVENDNYFPFCNFCNNCDIFNDNDSLKPFNEEVYGSFSKM